MSLKLAVIGTSHVGAIALAWEKIQSEFPDIKITFFAAPGWNFRRFQIDENKRFGILDWTLFAPKEIRLLENSFDQTAIALADFDAVVNVGHDTLETEFAALIGNFSISDLSEQPDEPMLSRHAYESFADALAEQAVLPEAWHGWQTPRLYVLPAPRIAQSAATSIAQNYASWRKVLATLKGKTLAALLGDYMSRVCAAFAVHNIQVLIPPAQVLMPNGMTQASYSERARRIDTAEEYPEDDHKHMNDVYGAIVLRHMCAVLQKDFGVTTRGTKARKTPVSAQGSKSARQKRAPAKP